MSRPALFLPDEIVRCSENLEEQAFHRPSDWWTAQNLWKRTARFHRVSRRAKFGQGAGATRPSENRGNSESGALLWFRTRIRRFRWSPAIRAIPHREDRRTLRGQIQR